MNGYLNGDKNYLTEGQNAGSQWAAAAGLPLSTNIIGGTLNVSVTGQATITATASFTGATMRSIFGKLFGFASYPVYAQATSVINTAPYLEVVMLLDGSASMDIGSTNADISKLEQLSPCDASNAFTGTSATDASKWSNQSQQSYAIYSCNNFHGAQTCPVPAPSTSLSGYASSTNVISNGFITDLQGVPAYMTNPPTENPEDIRTPNCPNLALLTLSDKSTMYPITGAPCAFACHWTTAVYTDPKTGKQDPNGTTADLYGMARRYGITLRIDEVKNAAIQTLQAMQQNNISTINNLSVGIYTFNTGVHKLYPASGEAASDFTAAQTAANSGIVPDIALRSGNNFDTAWPEVANSMATNYVTAAGDGNTPAGPRKVLFLVTDGFQDDPNTQARRAFDYNPYCTQFKDMNYQVYVVYTPYYPVMHTSYENAWTGIVEGADTTSGTLGYNLIQCSSQGLNNGGTYYISAQDGPTLTAALASFLKQALNNPARYTQ